MLVTHADIVEAAKKAKLIGEGEEPTWLDPVDLLRPFYILDCRCGFDDALKSLSTVYATPKMVPIITCPLHRFAGFGDTETHVYIGRCDRCRKVYFVPLTP